MATVPTISSSQEPVVSQPDDTETNNDKKKESKTGHKQMVVWSEDEDKRLFQLFKERGATWSALAQEFKGRTESQVKNRFYSTLRRVATKKGLETHAPPRCSIHLSKTELLQYIDEAMNIGHTCFSKRGRKKKQDVIKPVKGELAPLPALPQTCAQPVRQIPAPVNYMASNPVHTFCPPIYQQRPASNFCYDMPMWTRQQTPVSVQAKLEELVLLQQSVIRMLLQTGSAPTDERSTGFKK